MCVTETYVLVFDYGRGVHTLAAVERGPWIEYGPIGFLKLVYNLSGPWARRDCSDLAIGHRFLDD